MSIVIGVSHDVLNQISISAKTSIPTKTSIVLMRNQDDTIVITAITFSLCRMIFVFVTAAGFPIRARHNVEGECPDCAHPQDHDEPDKRVEVVHFLPLSKFRRAFHPLGLAA